MIKFVRKLEPQKAQSPLKRYDVSKEEINSIVKKVAKGSEHAFNILYEKMQKIIFHFLYNFTTDRDMIQDIMHDTYIVVLDKSPILENYENCFAWILTIARMNYYNHSRKSEKVCYIEDFENFELIDTSVDIVSKVALKLILDGLSSTQKRLFHMIYYDFKTYDEIAEIMSISVSTIKRQKEIIDLYIKERVL